MKDNAIERLNMAVEDALADGEPEFAAKIQKMIDGGEDAEKNGAKEEVKKLKESLAKTRKSLRDLKSTPQSFPSPRMPTATLDGSLEKGKLKSALETKEVKAKKDDFLGGLNLIQG